jgi:hypothetical protein
MARTTLNTLAPGQNQVDLRNTRAHEGDIITGHHDVATTSETVKQLLVDGTPDWVKWPQDYKHYAREAMAREKEISDEMVERYQMDDQEDLTNAKARLVHPMTVDEFMRKLRTNPICPVKCFTVYNGLPGTIGLWVLPPRKTGVARYVCYLRTPFMYEWSLLKLDKHNLPAGELRGWRTVCMELVKNEIFTEWQINQIFGAPSDGKPFRRYRISMWEIRNGKKHYTEEELAKKKDINIVG